MLQSNPITYVLVLGYSLATFWKKSSNQADILVSEMNRLYPSLICIQNCPCDAYFRRDPKLYSSDIPEQLCERA